MFVYSILNFLQIILIPVSFPKIVWQFTSLYIPSMELQNEFFFPVCGCVIGIILKLRKAGDITVEKNFEQKCILKVKVIQNATWARNLHF